MITGKPVPWKIWTDMDGEAGIPEEEADAAMAGENLDAITAAQAVAPAETGAMA